MAITVSLWDSHISAELKFERTLWALGVIMGAGLVALVVHLVFGALQKSSPLIEGIAERLSSVEELLREYLDGGKIDDSIRTALARLVMKGSSRLRQMLHQSGFDPQYAEQMGAVVALTGRLVDLAANLAEFTASVPESERERIRRLANRLRRIREDLTRGAVPRDREAAGGNEFPQLCPSSEKWNKPSY
ncbi:MAG: hypothetical protein JOZ22_23400 [Acidobacteriia bacterium]|nr:hypothetical protein [Terriglobia bacterium]